MGRTKQEQPERVSVAEYARHRGVTPEAVRKAIKGGRIAKAAERKGRSWAIDVAEADRRWETRPRPTKAPKTQAATAVAERAQARVEVLAQVEGSELRRQLEGRLEQAQGDYAEVRAIREEIEARLKAVELEKVEGRLVEVGPAWQRFATEARQLRDRLMALPERIGPALAAESGPQRCAVLLEQALVAVMEERNHGSD